MQLTFVLILKYQLHKASIYQLGRFDLSFSADSAGNGSCGFADSALQIGRSSGIDEPLGSCGADGFHQLYLALSHLHFVLLWLRPELLCRAGILPNLLRRLCHLGFSIDYQPNMVKIFLIWTIGMALA